MSHQTPQEHPHSGSGEGERFGRYRLRGILGQGGMGRLYVAEQVGIEGFSKVVALKRILPHLADSQHFRAMFLNEARVAARLEHPNIVATFELGEVDGNYFISMEYLSGEDLAAVLTRCQSAGPVPIEIAVALAQQSANGLHYAHEMRDTSGKALELVHRDVSPLNIFVTYYGMVKLLDFGIVKGVTDPSRTVPGVFKGKYAYCSPEQLDGGAVTRQTDIFCLGIVLWECLTGRRLFLRDTDAGTIDAVRGTDIEPPSALRKDVPRELDQIVLQALARQRVSRFGTAHAFSEALDRFLATRSDRPTSRSIGLWLESIFGSDRATLKKAIAQGSEVEAALNRLPSFDGERVPFGENTDRAPSRAAGAAGAARMPWSRKTNAVAPEPRVSPAGTSGPAVVDGPKVDLPAPLAGASAARVTPARMDSAPAARAPTPLRRNVIAGLVSALVVMSATLLIARSRSKADAPVAAPVVTTATLTLTSEPPGAQIFIDGDPSGMTTPFTLTGLRARRPIEVRLDKIGYRPVTEKIDLMPGETRARSFHLVEDDGTVVLEGLPPQAMVYVEDKLTEGQGPLVLSLGEHRIRVETAAGVVWSQTVTVSPGRQTIRVPAQTQKKGAKTR
jgi:serine/threonine-protein kinase